MNHAELMDLHAGGVTGMGTYFDEAEKTNGMLANCTAKPLPFAVRLKLASQEIVENNAHAEYLGIKRRLHVSARLGYEEDC
jgi:hypothetical protein